MLDPTFRSFADKLHVSSSMEFLYEWVQHITRTLKAMKPSVMQNAMKQVRRDDEISLPLPKDLPHAMISQEQLDVEE